MTAGGTNRVKRDVIEISDEDSECGQPAEKSVQMKEKLVPPGTLRESEEKRTHSKPDYQYKRQLVGEIAADLRDCFDSIDTILDRKSSNSSAVKKESTEELDKKVAELTYQLEKERKGRETDVQRAEELRDSKDIEIKSISDENALLRISSAELKERIAGLQADRESVELKLKEENQCLERELTASKTRIAQMENQAEANLEEVDILKTRLIVQQAEKEAKLEDEVKLKCAEIEILKRSNEDLKDRIAVLEADLESVEMKLKEENQCLERELTASKTRITQMENQAKANLEQVDIIKTRLIMQQAEKEPLIAKLEDEVKLKCAEIENLKATHEKERLEWRSMLIQQLPSDSDQNTEELTAAKSCILEMESDIRSKSREIEMLQEELNAAQSHILHLENEVKVKSRDIDYLKRDMDSAKIAHEVAEVEWMKENTKLRRSKSELESRISVLEGDVQYERSLKWAEKANYDDAVTGRNRVSGEKTREIETLKEELTAAEAKIVQMKNEIKSKSTNLQPIREKISNISSVPNGGFGTEWFEIGGLRWMVAMQKLSNRFEFYLLADVPKGYRRWYTANVEFRVISQKPQKVVPIKFFEYKHWSNECSTHQLIGSYTKKELFDDEKGYVKDDSIIVVAVIRDVKWDFELK